MEQGGDGHHEALHFHHPPKRVISLVPSLTESMFDLGLGSSVIGITDYCIYPAEEVVKSLTRVLGVVGVETSALALWVEWMAV